MFPKNIHVLDPGLFLDLKLALPHIPFLLWPQITTNKNDHWDLAVNLCYLSFGNNIVYFSHNRPLKKKNTEIVQILAVKSKCQTNCFFLHNFFIVHQFLPPSYQFAVHLYNLKFRNLFRANFVWQNCAPCNARWPEGCLHSVHNWWVSRTGRGQTMGVVIYFKVSYSSI